VKLLIDENLSRKLIARLSDLFPGSIHVTSVSLAESPDAAVWEYAKANGFTILTADADFFELTTSHGPPPKVLWLRRWNQPTRDAESVLRRNALRIAQFEMDADLGVLVMDKQ
jgi:predicted nuclease of predicted toxin-antitoxin system